MSFSADVAKFSSDAPKRVEKVRRGIILRLFNSVIRDTPVDTGMLRGNWQTSIATPKNMPIDKIDKGGLDTITAAEAALGKGETKSVSVFFVNRLPYAGAMEYGGSKQSPHGMVRRNVARISALVNRAIKEGKLKL